MCFPINRLMVCLRSRLVSLFAINMSGFGAHLTATSTGTNQPSIFEVIAQEGLVSSLRPALHHVLRVRLFTNTSWGCMGGVCSYEFKVLV